jgi:hypothetical protein
VAAYKVIQDIEAEDKLLGPLTFRQFVYAGFCAGFLFLVWLVGTNGALFLTPIFLLPAVLAGFFAFPWGRDQPTEVWALAKVRFMIKPRKRVWDQSGVKELVTITAPKRVQRNLTKGLSQREVKSRLSALANTLDSHGWVIRQTMPAGVSTGFTGTGVSANSDPDRLVSASAFQQPGVEEVTPAEDMLDEQNNPNAQRVSNMINASSKQRRQKVMEELSKPQKQSDSTPAKNNWFLDQPTGNGNIPDNMVTFNTQVVTPGFGNRGGINAASQPPQSPQLNEEQLVKELDALKEASPMKSYYEHMRTILPLEEQKKQEAARAAKARTQALTQAKETAKQKVQTPPTSPKRAAAMHELASNNDWSVATLAREANEVVIKLH